MFIAIVDFTVAAQNRETALDTLLAEAHAVRAMPGNLAFRPYADPIDGEAVRIVHEWQDIESFEAYASSDTFRSSGQALRPLMTSMPVSRRFTAQILETVS
jgi:quinol monooxygenase YgiN